MRCFQSSALADIVPAVRQVVDMLEFPQASSQVEPLRVLDERSSALRNACSCRLEDTTPALISAPSELEGRSGWAG